MATRKKHLSAEEAADYVGISLDEFWFSRARGLPPGILGYRDADRKMVWDRADLVQRRESNGPGLSDQTESS